METLPKVLAVDDDPNMIELLKDLLARHRFETVGCTRGELALVTLRDLKPDLLILDVVLADMDGIELLREIRSKSEYARLPVLVLTSVVAKSRRNEINGLGAGYLAKPFLGKKLIAAVQGLLAGRGEAPCGG